LHCEGGKWDAEQHELTGHELTGSYERKGHVASGPVDRAAECLAIEVRGAWCALGNPVRARPSALILRHNADIGAGSTAAVVHGDRGATGSKPGDDARLTHIGNGWILGTPSGTH